MTCVFRVYTYHSDTSTFSLVSQDALERCPSNVRDRTGESTVLDHTFDVQAFHSNHPVSTDQFIRSFEVKLSANILYFSVKLLNFLNSLAPITSKLLFSRKATLSPSQFRKLSLEESWISDMLTITSDKERVKPNINTNRRINRGSNNNISQVTRDNQIPLSSFSLQGKSFDRALDWTMQTDSDYSNVLNSQSISSQANSITVRGKLNRIKEVPSFESWVSRFGPCLDTTKESLEGFVQSSHSSLSRREVNSSKIVVSSPFSLEPNRLLSVFDRLLFQFVSIFLLSKAGIIQVSVSLKHYPKLTLLIFVSPKPVFESLSHLLSLLCLYVFSNRIFGNVSNRPGIIRPRPKCRKFRLQGRKLLSQDPRSITFEPIHNLSNSHCRIRGDKQVNVVRHNFDAFDAHSSLSRLLIKKSDKSISNFTREDFPSIFRAPHDVKLDIKDCSSVFGVSRFHTKQYIHAGYICQGSFSTLIQKGGKAHSSGDSPLRENHYGRPKSSVGLPVPSLSVAISFASPFPTVSAAGPEYPGISNTPA